jgi:hypothetical protein
MPATATPGTRVTSNIRATSNGFESARASVVNLPVAQTAAPAISPTNIRLFILAPKKIGDLDNNHREEPDYVTC